MNAVDSFNHMNFVYSTPKLMLVGTFEFCYYSDILNRLYLHEFPSSILNFMILGKGKYFIKVENYRSQLFLKGRTIQGFVPNKCISLLLTVFGSSRDNMYFFLNKKSSQNFATETELSYANIKSRAYKLTTYPEIKLCYYLFQREEQNIET